MDIRARRWGERHLHLGGTEMSGRNGRRWRVDFAGSVRC